MSLIPPPTATLFMNASFRLFLIASASAGAIVLALAWSANGQGSSKKRARPPKFDPREVEQIFFTDARKALVGKRPSSVARSNASKANGGNGAVPASATDAPPPATGAFRWSDLISAETLADEVKAYPALLAAVVKTPSQFKGQGARDARRYFSTVAAMFAIIAQYDRDVRWKGQAAAARELFARAGFNSKSDNENVFNEAKQRTADLTTLLRGESLIAPPGIEPNPSFNDQVSNRPPLMWRLERAQQDRLAVWTANAGEFKKNLAGLKHEAEIVAAMAKVIQHPSYVDAESESYIEYAQALQQAALEIRAAVEQKDAHAARVAAGNLSKACNACHADFRGE